MSVLDIFRLEGRVALVTTGPGGTNTITGLAGNVYVPAGWGQGSSAINWLSTPTPSFPAPTYAAGTVTCSNTYCHGATMTGATDAAPSWSATGCSAGSNRRKRSASPNSNAPVVIISV